jgi:hypothetical protein
MTTVLGKSSDHTVPVVMAFTVPTMKQKALAH